MQVSPRIFPALSLAFFFARAALSERLEQATYGVALCETSLIELFAGVRAFNDY